MEYLLQKVQIEYGFSDYQIKLIRYALTVFFYDLSKLLIFTIYFHATKKIIPYLFALIPFILLRFKSGGFHFQKYWTCLIFSFIYLFLVINVLPIIVFVHPLVVYPVLIICAILDYIIGPNVITKQKEPPKNYIVKAKLETCQIILVIAILFFLFSNNKYLIVSFWTVVLHTLQLTISKIIKEVKSYEKLT